MNPASYDDFLASIQKAQRRYIQTEQRSPKPMNRKEWAIRWQQVQDGRWYLLSDRAGRARTWRWFHKAEDAGRELFGEPPGWVIEQIEYMRDLPRARA